MPVPTKTVSDTHVSRKLFHSISILLILSCMIFLPRWLNWSIYIVCGLPLVALDFWRQKSPPMNQFFLKIMGPFMRRHEVVEISGSSWAILGIGLSYLFFTPMIAQLAVLFLAIGDPIASYCGLKWGRYRFWAKKSEAGLLAGMGACILSAFAFLSLHDGLLNPGMAIACGICGGVAESLVIGPLDDNLTQPLLSGALMTALLSSGVIL